MSAGLAERAGPTGAPAAGSGDVQQAAASLLQLVGDSVAAALGRCDVLMTTEQYAGLPGFPLSSFDAVIHYLPARLGQGPHQRQSQGGGEQQQRRWGGGSTCPQGGDNKEQPGQGGTDQQRHEEQLSSQRGSGEVNIVISDAGSPVAVEEQQVGDNDGPPIRYLLSVELPSLEDLSALAREAVARGAACRGTRVVTDRDPSRQQAPQLVARRLPFTITPSHPEDGMTLGAAAAGGGGSSNMMRGTRDSGLQQQWPGGSHHGQQNPAGSRLLTQQPGKHPPPQHEQQAPAGQVQPRPCPSGVPLVINSSPQSLMRSRRAMYEALLTLEATGIVGFIAPTRLGEGRGYFRVRSGAGDVPNTGGHRCRSANPAR